jgi:asparagine synthase (glutamine-hydrolysing)
MCGIFACFTRHGELPECEALARLTNTLRHRGPDAGAYWSDGRFFLGHRRLSIIDLAGGNQPMATDDGRYVVVFNGEIYNYVELRAELEALGHRFLTRSDTEVLLHGYRQWREELPSHLTGMFAFALVDGDEQTMFLARDRFGEKPLFCLEHDDRVLVASELKPLAAWLDGDARVDEQALTEYLCLNYVPLERSLLGSVARLAPGSWRLYTRQAVRGGVYWRPDEAPSPPDELRSLGPALDEVQRRLDLSVKVALRSDVPVALYLSGGMDSSLVAESAVRQGRLKDAFCLDFADQKFSEWDNAVFVAQRLGLNLHRVVLKADALDCFHELVDHADDPLADSSAVAVWTLTRETAKHFKVVISGDGGDELFGGYVTYRATALQERIVSRLPAALRRTMARLAHHIPVRDGKVTTGYKLLRFLRAASLSPGEAHFTWNGSFLPEDAARLLASPEAAAAARSVATRLAASSGLDETPTLSLLQMADVRQYLANDILVKVDRMTMAHSLESRAPLLNHHLAELALPLTAWHQAPLTAPPKRLLRGLADRIYGPRISRAPKQGFSIPIHDWLRGRGRDLLLDLLSPTSLKSVELLDARSVNAVLDRFLRQNEPLGFEVWGLLVLVAWHRLRIQFPRQALSGVVPDLPRFSFPRRAA